ncbi:MAG: hypothetical protein IIB53_08670 [Planctomycetes bacterium]|nr:hypothetical protein [Planctomycetota bacterium]
MHKNRRVAKPSLAAGPEAGLLRLGGHWGQERLGSLDGAGRGPVGMARADLDGVLSAAEGRFREANG